MKQERLLQENPKTPYYFRYLPHKYWEIMVFTDIEYPEDPTN